MNGIDGQFLQVTVVGCTKLKNTEWLSKQDPYVCLEYGSSKFRTKTHTDGGRNPIFQEKFTISLIEGLTDINVYVWNKNILSNDDFIGHGRVQLSKVLSLGYDDCPLTIQTQAGRFAGEVQMIMHYQRATHKPSAYNQPTAPPAPYSAAPPSYGAPSAGHYQPPALVGYPYPGQGAYPPPQQYSYPPVGGYPSAHDSYGGAYPPPSVYPPAPNVYNVYPPPQGVYPPSSAHYYPPPGTYPPGPYPPY